MSKIKDYIREWQQRRALNILFQNQQFAVYGGSFHEERMPFANVIFYNVCDLLTDIGNEVIWRLIAGDGKLYAGWKAFYDTWNKVVQNILFMQGYCVIGEKDNFFRILEPAEYQQVTNNNYTRIVATDPNMKITVLKSQTFILYHDSDWGILTPYLRYLDNALNASNTVSARLGSVVIMSPQNAPSAPTVSVLGDKQRAEIEEDLSKGYGALSQQKQVMLLTRPMNTQVLNLAGLDQKTQEKAKFAILAICDRIKVPANQVAIIDANSSKSLANGTELREGDLAKYRSFRRLLNCTFYQWAQDLGLQVDYEIENEPKTTQGDTIEQ